VIALAVPQRPDRMRSLSEAPNSTLAYHYFKTLKRTLRKHIPQLEMPKAIGTPFQTKG